MLRPQSRQTLRVQTWWVGLPAGASSPDMAGSRTRLMARALAASERVSIGRSATALKQADSVRTVWCSAPRALRKAAGDA